MPAFEWSPEMRFALALALGFLIGLERETAGTERKKRVFAGVRTYALLSLFGFACAWLYDRGILAMVPVGLAAVTALAVAGYFAKLRENYVGWTSEVAALTTFAVGVLCVLTDVWLPIALGIIATFLLSEKADLEHYVERLKMSEFLAIVRFLIVTVIILPVLPDQEYTAFDLNPAHIWKIVIMVSAVGFGGYFLTRIFGDRLGLGLSGFLGGIVSSTAVSVAVGRIAARSPERSRGALKASLIASSVMYVRILVLVWLVNATFVPYLWWKLLGLTLIGVILSATIRTDTSNPEGKSLENIQDPFELRPALVFAALFVMLSILTALVRESFGGAGLLVLSGAVGVTDIDPFLLSLVRGDMAVSHTLVMAFVVAMMSNTIAKAAYFAAQAPHTWRETSIRYGIWALLHLVVLFLPSIPIRTGLF